ncbi:hypothetical protein FUT87_26720, partial [Mitsuaria sp. TWR114]|uniref:UxaA family hydrolase n=1 Tax=Mitsuaria sp. TWR114 TaxID=2601731 RepID=UPI0011BF6C7C
MSTESPGEDAAADPGALSASSLIVLHPDDNIAVARFALPAGARIARSHGPTLQVLAPIEAGHKVALRAIGRGELVLKYGQPIGLASAPIEPGAHVHGHNLEMAEVMPPRAAAQAADARRRDCR